VVAIVVTRNRRELLEECLGAVLAQTHPPERVVVVDNVSSDGTPDMVRERFPSVDLVVNPENVGVAGWNAGFARGRGQLFLVLDDDCYIRGDALKRAVLGAREARADLVSFSVRSDVDATYYFNEDYHCGLLAFWGCAALISRRGVELTGGFDPNIFIWAHEAEFVARLLDGGLRHLYLPEVTAVHLKAPAQGPGSVYSMRLNTRNFAYIAGRLLRRRHALQAAANLLLRGVLIAIRRPAAARALPDVAEGLWAGLRHRQPVRAQVSAAYRENFIEFVNPVQFARGRWRSGVDAVTTPPPAPISTGGGAYGASTSASTRREPRHSSSIPSSTAFRRWPAPATFRTWPGPRSAAAEPSAAAALRRARA